jgi:carbon storage regulator
MLVITRKPGQRVLIGENIEIQIVDVQGEQVRIGIDAPKDISIVRKELLDEVKEVNREAVVDEPSISLEELGKVLKK